MYDDLELTQIQDIITGKIKPDEDQLSHLRERFNSDSDDLELGSNILLAELNPDLFEKVSRDPMARKCAQYAFFPASFPLFYESEIEPTVSVDQGNRGYIILIKHPEESIVIKPCQNSREPKVAKIAAELGVGPHQLPSLDGFLTEEMIEGIFFSKFLDSDADTIYTIGRRMGTILSKLHQQNILYNDTTLTDNFGRSHLFVRDGQPDILFDYGVTLLFDHDTLTDEEAFNLARTLPHNNMMLEFSGGKNLDLNNKITKEGHRMFSEMDIVDLLQRDLSIMDEGIYFALNRSSRFEDKQFLRGFEETYQL